MDSTVATALIMGWLIFAAEAAWLYKLTREEPQSRLPSKESPRRMPPPETPAPEGAPAPEPEAPKPAAPVPIPVPEPKPEPDIMRRVMRRGEKHAREYARYLESQGIDLPSYTKMGGLYAEALAALRRGDFKVDNASDVADMIDDWVRKRLLEVEVHPYNEDKDAWDVVVGDLHRQAVDLLRKGEIPLLGATGTADKLEQWVRREQLQRCGVKLSTEPGTAPGVEPGVAPSTAPSNSTSTGENENG